MKDDLVRSSPVKTAAAIPKLKLSLRLGDNGGRARGLEPVVALVAEETAKTVLPKITLSVRKPGDENAVPENSLAVSVASRPDPGHSDPPKRKRGRPPKNPSLRMEIANQPSLSKRHQQQPIPKPISRPMSAVLPAPVPLLPAQSGPILLDGSGLSRLKGPISAHSTIGDSELVKISRLKGHLSSLLDSDIEAINHSDYARPFSSKQDMVDRLLPFHLLSSADVHVSVPPNVRTVMDNLSAEMDKCREKFVRLVQSEDQNLIPTELKILEQRLCLEEEKFLLEKMCTEYKRRLAVIKGANVQ